MTGQVKWLQLDDTLHDYVVDHGLQPTDVQQELMEETASLGSPAGMQIAAEQAALLTWLVHLLSPRQALEVGTFTGLSSLAIARGLPAEGRLLCCDVSEEWTSIARRYWRKAGVDDRVELRIGPAIETLRALPAEPAFDFAFVDADKPSYPAYYEEILTRLRPGGVMAYDNVLWHGRVVDAEADDESTTAIRSFNETVVADARVEAVLLPIGDGLTLARKLG